MYIERRERLQPTPIPLSKPSYMRLVRATQLSGFWPSRLLSHTVVTGRRRILLQPSDIEPGYKYILAANHQSMADPFVICTSLPFPLFRRLGPFRYFAHAGLFITPLLRYFLMSFGGFPTRSFRGWPYGIEAARSYLGRNQSLVIFPEGKRTAPGITPVRDGIGLLAEDPLVRIIPVHIQWRKGRLRRRFQITIGRPMMAFVTAQTVLDAIYELELPR